MNTTVELLFCVINFFIFWDKIIIEENDLQLKNNQNDV